MIFAAIPWLSISINILLIVFVIVCLLMSLLILMQRPKQDGLGAAFGGGVTDQVFGARTTNVLQRGTVYLGTMFFLISLTLAILISKQTKEKQKSLLEPEKAVAEESTEKAGEIKAPEEEKPKSLAEELPDEEAPAPSVGEPASAEDAPAPPTEQPAPEAPAENAADKPE